MPRRIVIISDTHLGRPKHAARSAEALRPLWRGADRLIVNGDVAEVHHPRHWSDAARETLQLFDLCEEDDVALTLLSGNHDPYLTDLRHLHMAGHSILITHGDAFHPAIAPWSPAAGRLRKAHKRALAALEPESHDHLESRLSAAQHASHEEWNDLTEEAGHSTVRAMCVRPWAILQVLLYWRAFPKLAAAFAAAHAPRAKYIIVGHTHHAGVWTIGDHVIINTGSYGFPGKPRAVVLEGGAMTIHDVRLNGDAYELADDPIAAYELPVSIDDDEEPPHSALKTRPGSGRPSAARA